MLRRVYDTINMLHINFSSPDCKNENDDDVIYSDTFLKKFNTKVVFF
jgi:hypothetical protein